MLKQRSRAIALGVLLTDLALTAVSLPVAWTLRQGALKTAFPKVFPLPLHPLDQYLLLIFFILLPLAMTMALIWKTKEVILDAVFGERG